jgi:hypothetical protein
MCEKNYLRCEDRPIELFTSKLKGSQPVSSTHGRRSFTAPKNLLIQVINKYWIRLSSSFHIYLVQPKAFKLVLTY